MPIKKHGAGGTDITDATAVAGDVRTGTTAYIATGKVSGSLTPLDTSDATAAVGDIVTGKTAYVNGSKLTGTYVAPIAVPAVSAATVVAAV